MNDASEADDNDMDEDDGSTEGDDDDCSDGADDDSEANEDGTQEEGSTKPAPSGAAPRPRIVAQSGGNRPTVEIRKGLPSQVIVSVSPFSHRMPKVIFQAADQPITADPQHSVPDAVVIPKGLNNGIPPHAGRQKRIGRKRKFGNLLFCLPDGAVRFSSVISIFKCSGFAETSNKEDPWSVLWTKRVEPEDYAQLKPYQRVNHFPGTWSIGRKDNLHKRLMSRLRRHGPEAYGFFPQGFILPGDRRLLIDDMEASKGQKDVNAAGHSRALYIIKPVASACGRGVRLLTKPPKKHQKGLVQRYIHDPLLIHGFKFDLRIYVVVTSYDPLRIYVYEDGLVRFASSPYPTALGGDQAASQTQSTAEGSDGAKAQTKLQLSKKTAHLTNFSINKKNKAEFITPTDGEDADENQKASKWTLTSVKEYFARNQLDWAGTWTRIEDVIIKTILCAEPDVVQNTRRLFPASVPTVKNCFELYGFDVLLRKDLTPVLMEVNIMPSLSTKCSLLDQRVKSNMIADMLTLAGGCAPGRKHGKPKKHDPSTDHPFLNGLSADHLDCVMTTEEEYERRMHFKRLFPTATGYDHYRSYFVEHRPKNATLQAWEQLKAGAGVELWSQYVTKTKVASVLRSNPSSAIYDDNDAGGDDEEDCGGEEQEEEEE